MAKINKSLGKILGASQLTGDYPPTLETPKVYSYNYIEPSQIAFFSKNKGKTDWINGLERTRCISSNIRLADNSNRTNDNLPDGGVLLEIVVITLNSLPACIT